MTTVEISYLVFGVVLLFAIVFDLGLLSKRSASITVKKALLQTVFWVSLAVGFFIFLWVFQKNQTKALEYISAYLMEWSLSIDNIFVFILIFSFFKVREDHYARALLIGIMFAIVFRIAFIAVGVALIKYKFIIYLFGGFLLYTGIRIFTAKKDEEYHPEKNLIYRWVTKQLPFTKDDSSGKLTIKQNGKRMFTPMFLVIVLLATTDIVFAVDSIPAVIAISKDPLVIYTSNIFAVLGLRSLFFLLQGAVNQFRYLQQGIAVVLIFIGGKMLAEIFHINTPIWLSLMVILVCLFGSILYSIQNAEKEEEE
jgi:TerC family integral membrane protein